MILPKSGAILSGFSAFLFNYWKVLSLRNILFFSFLGGPKISSGKVPLEPTLFWQDCGFPGPKRRFRHRHFTVLVRFDLFRKKWPFTAKNNSFLIPPKNLIVTWYYSRSNPTVRFTGAPRRMSDWDHFWGQKWPLSGQKVTSFGTENTTFWRSNWPFLDPKVVHFPTRKWSFPSPLVGTPPPPTPLLLATVTARYPLADQRNRAFWL